MSRSFLSLATVGALAAVSSMLPACSGGSSSGGDPNQRVSGQSDFISAPPVGTNAGSSESTFGAAGGADNAATPTTGASKGATATSSQPRTVQETDLYRLDGNKL